MIKRLTLKRSSNSKAAFQEPPRPVKPVHEFERVHRPTYLDYADVVSERQVLPPEVLHELRKACALILRETGPSEEDYAAILNQPDPLDVFQKEQQDIRNVRDAASASQTSLPSLFHTSANKKRDSKHTRDDYASANHVGSQHIQQERSSKSHKHGLSKELSRKPVPGVSRYDQIGQNQHSEEQPLAPVTTIKSGPKQPRKSASTGQDLDVLSSRSKSRSKSQAVPALNYTDVPAERRRRDSRRIQPGVEELRVPTHVPKAPAEQEHGGVSQDRHSGPRNDPHTVLDEAKRRSRHEWMEAGAERDKRISAVNPDYVHVPTLHPTTYRPPQPYQPVQHQNRPQSRAGSIIDNIRGGIRDYVMPRPSLASTRLQSRSASRAASRAESRSESRSASRSSSRPPSRGSFTQTGRNWLKGAAHGLRRKNSWSSFRSNVDDEEEREHGKNRGPDLNRSLPPLPGLDQYKEPKLHIAHLLARGPAPPPIDTNVSATSLPQDYSRSPHLANGSGYGPTPPVKHETSSPLKKSRSPMALQSANSMTRAMASSQPASASGLSSASVPHTAGIPQSASTQKSAASFSQPAREPHPGNEHNPHAAHPQRTSSKHAPPVRMPFANDNGSAAASRVVSSIEPGFIDLELRRRLQGKVSSPVSPVDRATSSQPFASAQSLPPPPPEHEHPAFSKDRVDGDFKTQDTAEEGRKSSLLSKNGTRRREAYEKAPLSGSTTSEDRQNSLHSGIEPRSGALGVDRRPQLASVQSNSYVRAPEQQRRADSALGYSGETQQRSSRDRDRENGRTGSRGTVETVQSSMTAGTAPGALGGAYEIRQNGHDEPASHNGVHNVIPSGVADDSTGPTPRLTARDLAASPTPTSRAEEEDDQQSMREIVGGGALVGLEEDEAAKRRQALIRERERQLSSGGSDRGRGGRRYDDRDRERARAIAIMGAQEPSHGGRPGTWRRRTGSDPALGDYGRQVPKRGLRNRLSKLLGGGAGPDPNQSKSMVLSVN